MDKLIPTLKQYGKRIKYDYINNTHYRNIAQQIMMLFIMYKTEPTNSILELLKHELNTWLIANKLPWIN